MMVFWSYLDEVFLDDSPNMSNYAPIVHLPRQQKLEESLLFSGKFTDALQALMDWLYRAEPQLSEEIPLGGDRDLVSDLLDKHKAFQKELGKRASSMKTLKHSVRDLSRGGGGTDSHWLQRQMEELGHRWDVVCQLSVTKQARLEASLQQAEEFHSLVSTFLEGLGESERTLRYGVIPEDENALQDCQKQQQVGTTGVICCLLRVHILFIFPVPRYYSVDLMNECPVSKNFFTQRSELHVCLLTLHHGSPTSISQPPS
ncbi:hypothetical protein AB205_0111370 [Aquarana catesbeiana]|uniref:Uncharacterized protein n=1 Tax=Aquarana catesbeiana TaxID=8400 RepID=A0A2G9RVP0_AQUCT|nr:hypothetical protein AB205_0111370 [Aquarana catesbeiana]